MILMKPITGIPMKEIDEGARALSLMTFKQIKKMWDELNNL